MSDSIVTLENTKLIAKWMGKEIVDYSGNKLWMYDEYDMPKLEYNLITNSDQSREVEKKLLMIATRKIYYSNGKWCAKRYCGKIIRAETLELVIYKAALYEAKK